MDCSKCHDLLTDLLDNTLTGDDRRLLDTHFEECVTCTGVHADLDRIIALARRGRGEHAAPPDGQALWLRIREHVEEDMEWAQETRFATPASATRGASGTGSAQDNWWSRLWNARWEFSAPQVTGALAALLGVVVLATAIGTSALKDSGIGASLAQSDGTVSGLVPRTNVNPIESINYNENVRRQQSDIDYWRRRVEENRDRLPPRMRDSLDRTLGQLDQDVSFSLEELQRNPNDEVSEQMLNRALQDKIEILRELSSEF